MFDFTCQVCGGRPDTQSVQCPNCGSKISFEHGNEYSKHPLFPKRFVAIAASVVVAVTALNVYAIGSSAAAFSGLIGSTLSGLPGLGTPDGLGDSPIDLIPSDGTEAPTDTGTDAGTDSATDSPADNSGNTYSLTSAQKKSGFEEWESSGVAWRWATDKEMENLNCTETQCTFVKIIALRYCKSVLLNGSVSTDPDYDTQSEVTVGYGNNNIDNSSLKAGKSSYVEMGTSSTFDSDIWFYMSSITCGDQAIGHD